tara:strand:- start:106792 stop:107778 length:987 start_codon:yes stop_codon:yes gene_type:complete
VRWVCIISAAAYLACHPKFTKFNTQHLGKILEKLEENEKEKGIWAWFKEKWYSIEAYKAEINEKNCNDAEQLRKEIDEFVAYISEFENILNLYLSIQTKIANYFELISGANNHSRYEHGKIVALVGSNLVNVVGLVSKAAEVKKMLETLQSFTEAQWDNFFIKIDQRLGRKVQGAGDAVLAEINRIKNLRKTDLSKRIEELGKDLDKGGTSLIEGKAGAEIEEVYGYFERFKSTADKKGDWISLSGPYKGKTFDEIGGGIGETALSEFARVAKKKRQFFESIDLHFTKADYVVLNLTEMKRIQPSLYEEILNYISTKFGNTKLINISK